MEKIMNNDVDNIKLEKIEKNCYEIAKKQLKELQENNSKIIEETVEKKMEEYKESLSNKFEYDAKELKRDFNKEIYEFEMATKARISSFKKSLKNNLYQKVAHEIEGFINSDEYKDFLINNIKASMEKEKLNADTSIIYITEKDYYRFGEEIKHIFSENVEKISDENIGGSVVVDKAKKISVDNLVKTNILSKIEEMKI